ncbi:hypothetical protein HPC49_46780 [Pyxidicoccus fallax]|uniref:Uncharacterized protein n=1 Tax=Pyxidicoccus fallax TaxID=394095 RepID=A0A848LJX1_9BACT|nr:hypothetical protein [Pyxidicoccus fallax]NMO18019.1 hypothetical protein [Pyxidicoccus fallax]NPC85683.1 hypothetical protein [Pyxidicoccus fallax]
MESAIRPLRIADNRLLMPGVIGVREPFSISFGQLVHVLVGPDAGFPEYRPLDDWKHEVALAEVRSLPPELRKEAGIRLPEEELAEMDAYDREMAEFQQSSSFDDSERAGLRLEQQARLTRLDEQARRVLDARGHAYWLVGFTRHTDMLWVHRIGGASPFQACTGRWCRIREVEPHGAPAAWMDSAQYGTLWSVRWADRALRALSGGEVTESTLLFACRSENACRFLDDDVARAGAEAAARMSAGADEVMLPLHGPARRVRLPAFIMPTWALHPLEELPGNSEPREVEVPAEDAWVLVKDLR